MTNHQDAILDQFSRQAVQFSTAPGIKAALALVVGFSGAGRDDTVLDPDALGIEARGRRSDSLRLSGRRADRAANAAMTGRRHDAG